MTTEQDRYRGALLGLACGDAINGASPAHSFTSVALRLAHGLLDSGGAPTGALPSGGNALTVLAPLTMYHALDPSAAVWQAEQFTRTLDDTPDAIDCARLLAAQLCTALLGKNKDAILSAHPPGPLAAGADALAQGGYQHRTVEEITAGDAPLHTLEAALWCFWHTTSFKGAVLQAEHLGGATAAIVSQLAGAYYGVQDIPGDWLEKLEHEDELLNVADSLLTKRPAAG